MAWAHWGLLLAVLDDADQSSMEPVKHEATWWERCRRQVGIDGSWQLNPIGGSR